MAPADPGRDRLLAEQATSLVWAGRIGDAEAARRSLLDRDHDRSVEDAVRICLGHALLAAGRARDSLCELERACQSPVLTGPERASPRGWASVARLRLLDLRFWNVQLIEAGTDLAPAAARPSPRPRWVRPSGRWRVSCWAGAPTSALGRWSGGEDRNGQ